MWYIHTYSKINIFPIPHQMTFKSSCPSKPRPVARWHLVGLPSNSNRTLLPHLLLARTWNQTLETASCWATSVARNWWRCCATITWSTRVNKVNLASRPRTKWPATWYTECRSKPRPLPWATRVQVFKE